MEDEGFSVRDELIFVFPVLGFGIVGAEFDDDDVGVAGGGVFKLFGFPVGEVALFQEGCTAASEVLCFERFSKQFAEHFWVVVFVPFFDTGAEGDAVTDACDDGGFWGIGGERDAREGQGERGGDEGSEGEGGWGLGCHYSEGFGVGSGFWAGAATVRNPTVSHAQVAASSLKAWSEVRPAEA